MMETTDFLGLKGKKALVTGSSRGIGRAIALELSKAGVEIAIHYASRSDEGETLKAEIEKNGGKCCLIGADLCNDDCAEVIGAAIKKEMGHIDILVLNASMQYRKPWEEITLEEFDTQVHCNFRASLLLMQKFVPAMRENKWGRVITIGSIHEAKPNPDMLIYAATKTAQTTIAKSLAKHLAKDGITVNSIAPGVITTDRNAKSLSNPEWRATVMARVPMGYFGKPVDIAGTALLLCSEQGKYITGQNIYIDGGMSTL